MDTHFDVLVLGTGLTQSITAAALSKAGLKVVQVDVESYYGGNQASLTQEELINWCRNRASSSGFVSSTEPLPFARSYSISLAPALIPSNGPLIDALIGSGVSKYGKFKLLDASFIYDSSHNPTYRLVPGSKEDIFRARDISLIDKRKLMRFLQFASGEFENKSEMQGNEETPFDTFLREKFNLEATTRQSILYALAYCQHDKEPTVPALTRLRNHIQSIGRYGNSPFLIGHYGGLGELAQGFCRACAVNGGVYILGHNVTSLKLPNESQSSPASIEMDGVPDILTADIVITDEEHLSYADKSISAEGTTYQYACAIAILNRPIDVSFPSRPEGGKEKENSLDTCVVTFPPGSLPSGAAENVVRALQMGEETLSCPSGKYILYVSSQMSSSVHSSKELLQPYLEALAQPEALDFLCFYITDKVADNTDSMDPMISFRTLLVPQLPLSWTDMGDLAVKDAENMFQAIMRLKNGNDDNDVPFWPPIDRLDDDDNDFY